MKNNQLSSYTLDANRYSLTIGWLYPDLMNTYGDRGNIITLIKRGQWRGIKVEVKRLNPGFNHKQLTICNMLVMGGAQDIQQEIVGEDLKKKNKILKQMINDGTPGLFVCGGFQFLGKYYKEADGTIVNGLGIFDLYTENPGENHPRLIGNIAIKFNIDILRASDSESRSSFSTSSNSKNVIIGFENHGGRTYLGKNIKPFGKVLKGFGNNGKDGFEGAVYKNSFGTYLHGPILPKNPELADHLIKLSLIRKYKEFTLDPLDDTIEKKAKDTILNRLKIQNSPNSS